MRVFMGLVGLFLFTACARERASYAPASNGKPGQVSLLNEARHNFTYQGKPIHPKLVQQLLGSLAEPRPVIAAVDLTAAAMSSDFAQADIKENGDNVSYGIKTGDIVESFEYRRLGISGNGTTVLITADSGGGSGTFEDLVFLKFERCTIIGSEYPQISMRIVGRYPLGDRDQRQVTVLKDRVIIGA
jgi:hypothetical protein